MAVTETLTLGSNTGVTSLPAQLHFASSSLVSSSTAAIPQREPSDATTTSLTPRAVLSLELQRAGYDLREIDQDIARDFDGTLQDGFGEG